MGEGGETGRKSRKKRRSGRAEHGHTAEHTTFRCIDGHVWAGDKGLFTSSSLCPVDRLQPLPAMLPPWRRPGFTGSRNSTEDGTGGQSDGEAMSQVSTQRSPAASAACRRSGQVASREAGIAASLPSRDPGGGSACSRVRLISK